MMMVHERTAGDTAIKQPQRQQSPVMNDRPRAATAAAAVPSSQRARVATTITAMTREQLLLILLYACIYFISLIARDH